MIRQECFGSGHMRQRSLKRWHFVCSAISRVVINLCPMSVTWKEKPHANKENSKLGLVLPNGGGGGEVQEKCWGTHKCKIRGLVSGYK